MLDYSFHIQIQGVQLHETQPRPAIVAPHQVRQPSPRLSSPPPSPHPVVAPHPCTRPGPQGADLHSRNPVSGPSPGSPAETALQLPLPPDCQARPCQCSARAWPTRAGRVEGLAQPPNGSSGRRCGQRPGPPSFLTAPWASLPKLCSVLDEDSGGQVFGQGYMNSCVPLLERTSNQA